MKTSANTFAAKLTPAYQSCQIPSLQIKKSTANHARHKPVLSSEIKASGQFDTAVAHELRNPLATINLSVEMLKSATKDPDLTIYLDIIKRSSMRINDLIDDLLKYQQTKETETKQHSIRQLLDEVLEMAKDRIGLKDILLKKDFVEQDCFIIFDRPGMKIALTNIVMNAIDAINSESSEKGELKLVTKSIEDKYLIQIEDNGCGISERDIEHIFKPYFTNKPGGLGLGLSTTYDILLSNHVKINVESEKGKGTRFILSLNTSIQ